MPSTHSALPIAIALSCVAFVYCGEAASDETRRDLSLMTRNGSQHDGVGIARSQRDLFVRLDQHQDVADLTTNDFAIRLAPSRGPADTLSTADRRWIELLNALNARPPLDSSALGMAGSLSAYTDFQSYPVGTRQVVVVARREDGPIIMTDWTQDGVRWRARRMLVNPPDEVIARVRQRSGRDSHR